MVRGLQGNGGRLGCPGQDTSREGQGACDEQGDSGLLSCPLGASALNKGPGELAAGQEAEGLAAGPHQDAGVRPGLS